MTSPNEASETTKAFSVPTNFPQEVLKKIKGELKGKGMAFQSNKQSSHSYIQKGLAKPGSISFDTLRRAANSVHIARICINVLKEKVTKTKWVIKPIDPLAKVDEEKIKKVERLFKKPNQNDETFRTLLDKMLEDLLVLDSVSIEKTRFPDGELAELHFIDAATVRPVLDEYGNQDIEIPITLYNPDGGIAEQTVMPTSYVQVMDNSQYGGPESGQIVAAWNKHDLIYFHMHPQGSMSGVGYGLSPIESVLSVVSNILNADNYNGTYFEEGSFPPVILQMVGQMNSEELDAMREYMYQELTGNFHRPAIMAGAGETKVLNLKDLTNNDMQFMEYMKFLARLLAAAYGLSGQDIGLTDDLNKATSEVQKGLSEDKGYSSILHLLKAVFNENIIWGDFEYDDIEFDWVADDKTDPKDLSDICDKELRNGTLTLNEARQKQGKTPFGSWANVPTMLGNDGYVPLEIKDEEKEVESEEKEAYTEQTAEFTKSVYTTSGYKTYFDDRGYSQPFIFVDVVKGTGFVIKPPIAVNLMSAKIEEEITQELKARGLNVSDVTRMSWADIMKSVITEPEVRLEFDKYVTMSSDYDSEKWKSKHGGSRKYPYYLVSPFIDGYNLSNALLIADMKRDPESYFKAIDDLASLWLTERELVLGDRRADQYIITPEKRAYGFDYQFKGDKERYKNSSNAIPKALIDIPELYERFIEKTSETKKGILKSLMSKLSKKQSVLSVFDQTIVAFGTFVSSRKEIDRISNLFEKQSEEALIEEGFEKVLSSHNLEAASKSLQERVKKNSKSCGGILARSEEAGTTYCVYIKD